MTTLYTEGDTDAQYAESVAIMELLTAAYPGHPWAVRVAGGVVFIRYLDDRLLGNWGMAFKQKDVNHDAAVLKSKVIMMAGEWLERAGLGRGPSNGDEIVTVEGIPDRDQPNAVNDMWTTTTIVCDPGRAINTANSQIEWSDEDGVYRSEPRPQALKGPNG